MQDFRNLKVWQRAHELVLLIYRLTHTFPKEELFGLRNSLRRTAVEIPALVAEGAGKASDQEFSKCISSALGFGSRLEYFSLLARDLEMFGPSQYDEVIEHLTEVKKMLNSFNTRLRSGEIE